MAWIALGLLSTGTTTTNTIYVCVTKEACIENESPFTYLISLFLLMTKQTKEFPTIVTTTRTQATVVIATCADSDMANFSYINLNKKVVT